MFVLLVIIVLTDSAAAAAKCWSTTNPQENSIGRNCEKGWKERKMEKKGNG
jgi:hypothetical protein